LYSLVIRKNLPLPQPCKIEALGTFITNYILPYNMRNLVILIIVLCLLFAGCYNEPITPNQDQANNKDPGCIEEGENVYDEHLTGVKTKCCEGLTSIIPVENVPEDLSKCSHYYGIGNYGICSNCGDGLCKPWENACNCPEDCKEIIWETYNHGNYSINHPNNLNFYKVGSDYGYELVEFSSKDFEMEHSSGNITKGFLIHIYNTHCEACDLDTILNKEDATALPMAIIQNLNSLLWDYKNGDLIQTPTTISGYPAVKYEFISTVGRNNNIGLVIDKDKEFWVALIAYRNYKDMELFNKILNSFELK